jgi:hypothetical protein
MRRPSASVEPGPRSILQLRHRVDAVWRIRQVSSIPLRADPVAQQDARRVAPVQALRGRAHVNASWAGPLEPPSWVRVIPPASPCPAQLPSVRALGEPRPGRRQAHSQQRPRPPRSDHQSYPRAPAADAGPLAGPGLHEQQGRLDGRAGHPVTAKYTVLSRGAPAAGGIYALGGGQSHTVRARPEASRRRRARER